MNDINYRNIKTPEQLEAEAAEELRQKIAEDLRKQKPATDYRTNIQKRSV